MSTPNFGIPGVNILLQGAPYDPTTLHPPLTAAQRAAIIAWTTEQTIANGGTVDTAQVNSDDDATLIQAYAAIYNLQKVLNAPIAAPSIPNPLTSVEQFLTLLTSKNLWVRVGEFAVGGILLAVGVSHMLGASPKTVASGAVKVSPAGRVSKELNKTVSSGGNSYKRSKNGAVKSRQYGEVYKP